LLTPFLLALQEFTPVFVNSFSASPSGVHPWFLVSPFLLALQEFTPFFVIFFSASPSGVHPWDLARFMLFNL
jgi:hypothetical protein